MCGIVGYVGPRPAAELLVTGLRRLEYRGYDSAGIATLDGDRVLHRHRAVGEVDNLARAVAAEHAPGTTGIAHTRWATHGAPNERNAHPHFDASGTIAVVHNGIIENYRSIRAFLTEQGIDPASDTDTEALAQLIGYLYHDGGNGESGNLLASVRRALHDVRGTFGLLVLSRDHPDQVIAARRGSPVLVGVGDGEYVVASDGAAVIEHTRQVVYLDDNEIALLTRDGLRASTIDDIPLSKHVSTLEVRLQEIELDGHRHHMSKEIHEQPAALRNTLRGRVDLTDGKVVLGGLADRERELARYQRVILTGCGTAWHAGLVGEYLFEELARVPAEVEYASELRYRNPVIQRNTLGIVLSQSGETADTVAALRELQLKGATTLGIVNVVGSSIARETDAGVYLHVGPEIGVASTKAFTGQVAVLALLAINMGRRRHLSAERTAGLLTQLDKIPAKIERILAMADDIRQLTERYVDRDNWLYLGRGVNYPVALEGALKLKEISYIHAEGLPAAEMKHGPIALIDRGMPVVVVAPRDHTYDKVVANIEEVKGRAGSIIAIATEGDRHLAELADAIIYVPKTHPLLSPLVTTIPLQLMAYYAALARGHNVDRPRNLAKSVTVE
jgi:glucosamine--fructose-6-phosphate aminotransferase (isomerizing)